MIHRYGGIPVADAACLQDREFHRKTGIEIIETLPWGTHFSQFYATPRDLLETLVPYFREGLAANEFCMWVTSKPLTAEEAKVALRAAVPDLDERLAHGQIEILDHDQWYTKNGCFDAESVIQGWAEKLQDALQRGFVGLRLTGNTFWLEDAAWDDFKQYENAVHRIIGGLPVLALCSYSLDRCGPREILDVVGNHEFALIKREGKWETLRGVEHQAEQALRESRDRLAHFAAIAFEGVAITENGKVVDCNEQFAHTLGYSIQELKGIPVADLVAPEDLERIIENIRLGRESHVEHAALRKDGSRIFVEARGRNSPVNPAQRYTVIRDITERKKSEAALRVSQADLSRAQAVGHIGSWRMDVRLNELTWSEENHRIFGIPKGVSLTYETFLSTIHPEDRDYVDRKWMAALEGEPYDIEHRLLVDGKVKWVRERAELEFDRQGSLLGGFGTTQDITDRKQAEMALQESEERFRAMVQAVPSFTFENDAEGRCTFVSESWCVYTGMSVEETLGGGWIRVLHEEDREAASRKWVEAVAVGEPFEGKYRMRAKDGSYRWFMGRALPRRDSEGKLVGWAGSLNDINDLVHAQVSLLEADRRKDEFLAMLAHELRNPLVPIRNAAHVLNKLGLEHPRIQWAQEVIEGQVSHLARLVDDLLDVSRIVRGKITLQKEVVDFSVVANRALEAVRPLMESKRHELVVHLPKEAVRMEADPVRLTQILLNLLDNAAKYGPDGGRIEFSAAVEGQGLIIRVRDNGIGIPPDLLPHVFELFQQGERALDRNQGGLGIGLTLVQRLAEMHGGGIEAQSDGEGKGALFTLRLPIQGEGSMTSGKQMSPGRRPVQGVRVLLVDDDHAVADSTAILLEMEGHEVQIARNGYAALEAVPVFRPQAVLLDIGLDGMDGFETARRLRQLPEGQSLFLIAVTGYGDEESKTAALDAGCDQYLIKPVKIDHLTCFLAGLAAA